MAREGFYESLLTSAELHSAGCHPNPREDERCIARPVVDPANGEIVVVYVEWCIACGAADWEVV